MSVCALRPATENQRSVNPAKGEVVVHHVIVVHVPEFTAQVVQLATAGVNFVQVEGVDVTVAVHHFDAEPRLQRPASTQGVAQKALL